MIQLIHNSDNAEGKKKTSGETASQKSLRKKNRKQIFCRLLLVKKDPETGLGSPQDEFLRRKYSSSAFFPFRSLVSLLCLFHPNGRSLSSASILTKIWTQTGNGKLRTKQNKGKKRSLLKLSIWIQLKALRGGFNKSIAMGNGLKSPDYFHTDDKLCHS